MENFSTILQTVWRPAQKNSWGGGLHQPPPDRARVKKHLILCLDETKMDLKPLIMLF